jgi:hypothetical protein
MDVWKLDPSVRGIARDLPRLTDTALDLIRRRRPSPLEIYLSLARDAAELDLTSATAVDFRRRFNGFYGVRRNEAWRCAFYRIFETAKSLALPPRDLFRQSLLELERVTGRVEASFVSKLVATLWPEAPVIDSVIRGYLASRSDGPQFGGGVVAAIDYFEWLAALFTALTHTPEVSVWCNQFDASFEEVPGAASIHPIKKLDFLIWAGSR